jgi:hypothetical protein
MLRWVLAVAFVALPAIAHADNGRAPPDTCKIADHYADMGLFPEAAALYERAPPRIVNGACAARALKDALRLRIGMGQEVEATRDVAAFLEEWESSDPRGAAQVVLTLAEYRSLHEEWTLARRDLRARASVIDAAPLDVRVSAHVILAHASAALGEDALAADEYARVRGIWKDPVLGAAQINAAWSDEDDARRIRRLARVLNAVGEATFDAGERARKSDVEALRFPSFAGKTNDAQAVLDFVNTAARDWYVAKQRAIEATEQLYVRVLDIQPVPPPRWVVAAAATVGIMWSDFVDEVRRAPVPERWKKDAVLRRAYEGALAEWTKPLLATHAKPAMRKCLEIGRNYQYWDERTRTCEQWLEKNFDAEFLTNEGIAPRLMVGAPHATPPPLREAGAGQSPDAQGMAAACAAAM